MNTQHVTDTAHGDPALVVAYDLRRVAFMASLTNAYLRACLERKNLPKEMNRNVLQQTLAQNERLIREIKRTDSPHEPTYIDRKMKTARLEDLGVVVDIMSRIGIEESPEHYEDFFDIMIDCINEIFYAQQNRKKINFSKYKALFKMFVEEMRADTNRVPGRLVFIAGKGLFGHLVDPVQNIELSDAKTKENVQSRNDR